jgi:hypothetical protein
MLRTKNMKNQKHLEHTVLAGLQKITNEYFELLGKRSEIELKLHVLKGLMNSYRNTYEKLTGDNPPIKTLPIDILSSVNPNLGNALEVILKEHKALEINKVIELLRERGVKLSLKNPRNVLANLVKNDKKKSFTRLEDGKIALRENK